MAPTLSSDSELGVRSAAGFWVEPAYYREQAQLSRELADRCDDHEISLHLHSVAKQYDKLADEAEKKNR